jgi:hypothetical protein
LPFTLGDKKINIIDNKERDVYSKKKEKYMGTT